MGGFGEVEPFAGTFVNLENRKRAAGSGIRINARHVWIFFKQDRQPLGAELPRFALHGYRCAGEGILSLHGGKRNMFIRFQTFIEMLALCGQKIKPAFVIIHQVYRTGDGMPHIVNGCGYAPPFAVSYFPPNSPCSLRRVMNYTEYEAGKAGPSGRRFPGTCAARPRRSPGEDMPRRNEEKHGRKESDPARPYDGGRIGEKDGRYGPHPAVL